MAGTILPIVYGNRQLGRPPVALWLHTIGCIAGAAGAGASLGILGALFSTHSLSISRGTMALLVTGIVSLLYSA
jgi:hypothetical protein